jgi:pimeloyl-ACP methyl ester carboxylesterase
VSTRAWAPDLPPRRSIRLGAQGEVVVREAPGPPGAETVVLIHGLTATADLNWFACIEPLSKHFRVLTIDNRGHGEGIRTRRFRLDDCADDIAALISAEATRAILVGYSMGGAIAQLVCLRHRSVVIGAVLCASQASFPRRGLQRITYKVLSGASFLARVAPELLRPVAVGRSHANGDPDSPRQVWARSELRRNDVVALLQAPYALSRFDSSGWLQGLDVPTAVVVTTQDAVVSPRNQRELAQRLADASVFEAPGGHGIFVEDPEQFVPVLVAACLDVGRRARTGGSGE